MGRYHHKPSILHNHFYLKMAQNVSLWKMDEHTRALYISLRLAIKILILGDENESRKRWEDQVRNHWNGLPNHLKRCILIDVVKWMQDGKSDACMKTDCQTLSDLFAKSDREDWLAEAQTKHVLDVVAFEDGGCSVVNSFNQIRGVKNSDLVSALYEKYLRI